MFKSSGGYSRVPLRTEHWCDPCHRAVIAKYPTETMWPPKGVWLEPKEVPTVSAQRPRLSAGDTSCIVAVSARPTAAPGKRAYQCPGCFSLTFWKIPKDPGAAFECECGERLTRIDLRDPEPQAIPRAVLDRLDALEAVAEAARDVAFVYVEPVMDEDLPALRAALARLDSLTEVTK